MSTLINNLRVTIEQTAVIPNRPAIAKATIKCILSAERKKNSSYIHPIKLNLCDYFIQPLGKTINDSKKNPDNANRPHDDIFRPKNFNKVIDNIRLTKSTAPVAAT